jgi:hypothetical protein
MILLKLILMKSLFQKAYLRLSSRLPSQGAGGSIQLPVSLSDYSHDILYRLPRDDFKLAVKIPCIVQEYFIVLHSPKNEMATV